MKAQHGILWVRRDEGSTKKKKKMQCYDQMRRIDKGKRRRKTKSDKGASG